jgi:hypothetical protein
MMALDVENRLDCWNFETASGLPSEVSDIKTGQRIRTKLVLVSDGNTPCGAVTKNENKNFNAYADRRFTSG